MGHYHRDHVLVEAKLQPPDVDNEAKLSFPAGGNSGCECYRYPASIAVMEHDETRTTEAASHSGMRSTDLAHEQRSPDNITTLALCVTRVEYGNCTVTVLMQDVYSTCEGGVFPCDKICTRGVLGGPRCFLAEHSHLLFATSGCASQ